MIYNSIHNAYQYYNLGENIKKGFEFLQESDFSKFEDGKYEIDGDNVFANVQTLTTKPVEEQKWEAHKKYIDIQYLIAGSEKIGYGNMEDFGMVAKKYDEKKDVIFLDDGKYSYVNLSAGDFVVFYTNDVHAPMLCVKEPQEIRKVIVKVRV